MSEISDLQIAQKWASQLQRDGYRITNPRKAVLQVIAQSHRSLDPSEILKLGRGIYPGLSLVTVYRTLEKMEQIGLVIRVHQADHCQSFAAGLTGHQHLLICSQCAKVIHFEGDDVHLLAQAVEKQTGFTIKDHWLQLFGICPTCKENNQK